MRLTLPPFPRRIRVDAFWMTMGMWVALAAGVGIPARPLTRVSAGLLAGLITWTAARQWPARAERAYILGARATRLWARVTRRVLLVVCHSVVMTVVGVGGSRVRLSRPAAAESFWVPRATSAVANYEAQFAATAGPDTGRPWMALARWAVRSGNAWALVLVPFLALMAALDDDERRAYPQGIYTLF